MAAPGRAELIRAIKRSWQFLLVTGGDLRLPSAVRKDCIKQANRLQRLLIRNGEVL